MGRPRALRLTLAAVLAAGCAKTPPAPAPDRIVLAVPHHLIALDPHSQDTLSTFSILGNVYEPLVDTDAALRLRPCLAERWESPDPLTWVFPLRRGVRFHDGRELQAKDVVATIRRLLDDPLLDVRVYLWNLADVDAPDPYTVRLRTKTPWPTLLLKLTQVYVVPAGATTEQLANATNGTGPYRVTDWQPGKSLRLTRFDGHWRGRSAIAEAVVEQRECASVTATDLAQRYDLVGTACAEPLPSAPGFRVERRPGLYVKYLGMDVSRATTPYVSTPRNPFRDIRVRQAVSLAVDRQRLVRELGLPARPAYQPVPKTVLGYDPDLDALRDSLSPALARRLMNEAGYPQGFDVTLHVREPLRQGIGTVQEDLAAVGIRTKLEVLDEASFADRMSRGEGSLWLTRFACTGGDSSDLFEAFFSGQRRYSVHGGYANEQLERDFAAIAGSEGPRDRRNGLQGLLTRLSRDVPLVPLYNDEDVWLVRGDLEWQPRNDACLRLAEMKRTGSPSPP